MLKGGVPRRDLEAMVTQLERELTRTKEQLSQVVQATGWGPTIKGTFYYLSTDGTITAAEVGDNWTDWMHRMVCSNNVFSTEEKAKQMLTNKNLYHCLQRYADENDTDMIDWDNTKEPKWYIALDMETCELIVNTTCTERLPNVVYFHNETVAQEARALFLPDLTNYYTLNAAYVLSDQGNKNFSLWEEEK